MYVCNYDFQIFFEEIKVTKLSFKLHLHGIHVKSYCSLSVWFLSQCMTSFYSSVLQIPTLSIYIYFFFFYKTFNLYLLLFARLEGLHLLFLFFFIITIE